MDWNLDSLYPSLEDASYEKDYKELLEYLKKIEEYKKQEMNPSVLSNWLKEYREMMRRYGTLTQYPNLRTSVNVDDTKALKAMDRIRNLSPAVNAYTVAFSRALENVDVDAYVEENEFLKEHKYFLESQKEENEHLLDDAGEELLASLTQTGAMAFSQLKELVGAKHMVEVEINGETKEMPLASVRNLAYHADPTVRKEGYEKELASYKKIEDVVAASLNAIKGESITKSRVRNFESPLAKSLHTGRMDDKILDSLWTAIDEYKPMFRKYLQHKAKLLGHEGGLPFYDLFAPAGEVDLTYTFDEAAEYVIDKFYTFSDSLGDFAKRAYENNWIDSDPKKGKRGGAFCSNLHAAGESRIMMNFSGSFSNLTTLAHELGHGYHGDVLKKQSQLNARYPMPLAETASTFAETLVTEAAIKEADDATKAAILENSISGVTQTCLDIRSRFLFEDDVFEKRKDGQLSVEELKESMAKAQDETYGDGLQDGSRHAYMWINKPHYFMAGLDYYNYPYAFGNLFALGLYQMYLEEKDAFVEKYDTLLTLTGQADVYTVAKSIGIDLHKPDFFKKSLDFVQKQIDTWIELTEK